MAFATFPAPAKAATVVQLRLTPDGSANPPGDRIDVRLFLLPGEGAVTLKAVAFALGDQDEALPVPTRAHGGGNRGPEVRFELTKELRRSPPSSFVDAALVIPYANLGLPPGNHEVFYRITASSGSGTEEVLATQVTRMTVTGEVRHTMQVRRAARRVSTVSRTATAYVTGETTRGAEGVVQPRTIRIAAQEEDVDQTVETVLAEIAGAFLRQHSDREVPASTKQQTVYFGTNRVRQRDSSGGATFGATVSPELTFGSCVVNVPVRFHRQGRLERSPDGSDTHPGRNFQILSTSILDSARFPVTGPRDTLLYVHGYNNSFQRTILRFAQISHDLEFPGPTVAFCWASAGDRREYLRDGRQAAQSVAALANVIRVLLDRITGRMDGRAKLHVLAHSLGNQILLGALQDLYRKGILRPGKKPLGQVVLAAPDLSVEDFARLVPYAIEFAEQTTYYYCSRDIALGLAAEIKQAEPVGLSPFFREGLDTINADNVDMRFPFHDYFASSWQMLLDMQLLFNNGLRPAQRETLAPPSRVHGQTHWSFQKMVVSEAKVVP